MSNGFYWSANSAYIKAMWLRVRRAPRAPALSTTIADGFIPFTAPDGTVYQNANPAYIVYECLTNGEWGMGEDPAMMDVLSFKTAAATLLAEAFGLFVTWVKQSTIEDFVSEILDHVQAVLFLHPRTGLWTFKLLRDDYDVSTLPSYNPDNADIDSPDRKVWGETVNEIVVTWTNPVNEQAETVTVQDIANIVQQGGQIVSQSRNYYGIRSASVAAIVAARDLRTAVAPLFTCTLKAFRSAWKSVPGDCLVLNWPEESVVDTVMRVQSVDYGKRSDGYVNIALIEDIFARDAPALTVAPSTRWASTTRDPNPFADVKLFTAPAFLIANANPPVDAALADPEVVTGLLLSDPNPDISAAEPYTQFTLANGTNVQQSIGTRERVGHALLTSAFAAEAFTTIGSFAPEDGPLPQLASLVFIGGGGDSATEIALVQTVAADGTYTLARGVLDTIPRAWPIGTPMWFYSGQAVLDTTQRAPGEVVTYRPLMRTSRGLLPYADAPDVMMTASLRPYLPLRPANVQVNGQGFASVIASGDLTVTWSNRNRLLETSQILGWTAATVMPESGQTTTVRLLDSGGAMVKTYTGLTGTSFTVPSIDAASGVAVQVASVNADGESLQSYTMFYSRS